MPKALRSESLFDFLRAVRQDARRLVAPVQEDGLRLFREVERVEEIVLAEGNTRWSFKETLLPRSEALFHYRLSGASVDLEEPDQPVGETVIFGARPCDAASLAVLDAVFAPETRQDPDKAPDHEDPFYRCRRAQTTIIGLSCTQPGPACFCTAVGLSPTGTEGSDLLLTPIPGAGRGHELLLAEAVTEKGERLLAAHASLFIDVQGSKDEVTRSAEARMACKAPIGRPTQAESGRVGERESGRVGEWGGGRVGGRESGGAGEPRSVVTHSPVAIATKERPQPRLRRDGHPFPASPTPPLPHSPTPPLFGPLPALFEGPRWEELAERCLGCGACAFVCPTCHCFDIVDEGNARGGSRCKFWDSCGFALFTAHTSGHNPRATQPARFRQRVLHKLRYIPERFGVKGCVGCGRCIAACPVNMDVHEVASAIVMPR